jgi:hypothetical protein
MGDFFFAELIAGCQLPGTCACFELTLDLKLLKKDVNNHFLLLLHGNSKND